MEECQESMKHWQQLKEVIFVNQKFKNFGALFFVKFGFNVAQEDLHFV